ncbi:MAG: splicing factor [Bathelium mastoideum]|nr:MAG: splicing factor [Bathelium mastoideum]
MASEQRKLLEQLMGDNLMTGPGTVNVPKLSITDPKLCRSYLVGTCPHDLFTNTKQDIGPCARTHSEALRAEYQEASAEQKRRWGFEFDYLWEMKKYVDECNRRIDSMQRRLEKNPDEIRQTNALLKQIGALDSTVDAGLTEIRAMAELGSVALAVQEHYRLQQALASRADKERELRTLNDTSGPSGHQKLQVCDVCGAYLSRLDNDRRLADHFYGKMHLGYAQMRKTHDALQKELQGRAPPSREPESPAGPRGGGDFNGGFGGGDRGYGGRGGFRGGFGGRGGGYRGRGGYGRW